jgi:ketosteroid isomerase-like protein
MSEENVEIVRRSFDAWNAGDLEAIRSLYADEVVVVTGITEFGRTFEGDYPIRRWVAEVRETWAEVHFDYERIFEGEADDVVVSFYRAIGIGRQSGVEVVRDLTGVYRLRDGPDRERAGLPRPRRGPRSRRAAGVGRSLPLWTRSFAWKAAVFARSLSANPWTRSRTPLFVTRFDQPAEQQVEKRDVHVE